MAANPKERITTMAATTNALTAPLPSAVDEVAYREARNARLAARLRHVRGTGGRGYLTVYLGGTKVHAAVADVAGHSGYRHPRALCQPHTPRTYGEEYDPVGDEREVTCMRCLASLDKLAEARQAQLRKAIQASPDVMVLDAAAGVVVQRGPSEADVAAAVQQLQAEFANPQVQAGLAAALDATQEMREHQLQVGDVFTDDQGRTFEVLALTPRGRSRTQRQLPDGKPYRIAPSVWSKVQVQRTEKIDPDTQGAPGNDGSRAARKGATMATSTKKRSTKAKGAGRPKAAPMTAAQAKAAVAANKEGALAYMTAREEARQGVQGAAEAQEKHRPAYTLYKRAYGHPSLQAARQKARDKKAAKAPAKSAKPKAPKSEPVVEPVASTEGEVVASGGTEG